MSVGVHCTHARCRLLCRTLARIFGRGLHQIGMLDRVVCNGCVLDRHLEGQLDGQLDGHLEGIWTAHAKCAVPCTSLLAITHSASVHWNGCNRVETQAGYRCMAVCLEDIHVCVCMCVCVRDDPFYLCLPRSHKYTGTRENAGAHCLHLPQALTLVVKHGSLHKAFASTQMHIRTHTHSLSLPLTTAFVPRELGGGADDDLDLDALDDDDDGDLDGDMEGDVGFADLFSALEEVR
eukprot:scaffold219542_cov30-Tisochrysis_lutea.AAC.1